VSAIVLNEVRKTFGKSLLVADVDRVEAIA